MPKNTILIAAGGTGGHIFPGIATASALQDILEDINIEFVGTKDRMEATLVPEAGYHLHTVEAMALPRKADPRILKVPFVMGKAIRHVNSIIKNYKGTDKEVIAAVGFGGYTSVSLGFAAKMSGVPLIIHEQNAVPGVTNKILSILATRVAGTFLEAMDHMGAQESGAIGNPVRKDFSDFAEKLSDLDVSEARREAAHIIGLDPERKIIVVFGGSQGAQTLNDNIVQAAGLLEDSQGIQILHATGEGNLQEYEKQWGQKSLPDNIQVRVEPFIKEMGAALACADVALCRSGASTIAELTVLGVPAILVPYPHATGNHQMANAKALEKRGAAKVIENGELEPALLAEALTELLDTENNQRMKKASKEMGHPDAAYKLAELIDSVAIRR